jgi:hypothetical protein
MSFHSWRHELSTINGTEEDRGTRTSAGGSISEKTCRNRSIAQGLAVSRPSQYRSTRVRVNHQAFSVEHPTSVYGLWCAAE